jgi:hypothetical protein
MVERGGGVRAVLQHVPALIQNWQLQHHLRRASDPGAVATGGLLRPKARDSGLQEFASKLVREGCHTR